MGFDVVAFAEDRTQASADEAIEVLQGLCAAVFEVLEPAAQGWVETADDVDHAVPRVTRCLRADGFAQLENARLSRPAPVALDAITEELEARFLRLHVDDPCL